jgi:hypothetical protein
MRRPQLAIIRFLDRKGRCCQVSTADTHILVYFNENEKKTMNRVPIGDAMFILNSKLPEYNQEEIVETLNTKSDPLCLS